MAAERGLDPAQDLARTLPVVMGEDQVPAGDQAGRDDDGDHQGPKHLFATPKSPKPNSEMRRGKLQMSAKNSGTSLASGPEYGENLTPLYNFRRPQGASARLYKMRARSPATRSHRRPLPAGLPV